MTLSHLLNVIVHASAGVVALLVGFAILYNRKGSALHRKLGKVFCFLGVIVCGAAASGLVFFRFLPVFSVITVLVSYQLVSGWHVIYTRQNGPDKFDFGWTLLAIAIVALLLPVVLDSAQGSRTILFSTLGALAFVLLYDLLRWCFPQHWHVTLWRYEHSYKLLSSFFGMLSSFVGNTVRIGQPWSQIIPSLLGLIVIGYYFYKTYSEDRRRMPQ